MKKPLTTLTTANSPGIKDGALCNKTSSETVIKSNFSSHNQGSQSRLAASLDSSNHHPPSTWLGKAAFPTPPPWHLPCSCRGWHSLNVPEESPDGTLNPPAHTFKGEWLSVMALVRAKSSWSTLTTAFL